jgi:hypothetical protein
MSKNDIPYCDDCGRDTVAPLRRIRMDGKDTVRVCKSCFEDRTRKIREEQRVKK